MGRKCEGSNKRKRQIIGVYKRITAGGILQTVILDN